MSDFKSYSQNDEDLILKNILGNSGYFLEIGSFHPFVFSNTRFLVERGWHGCYVDCSPLCLHRFVEEYKSNSNITIVNAVVGDRNEMVTLYDSIGDGISSVFPEHMQKWSSSGSEFKKLITSMITVDKLYPYLNENVDFINIDVEGNSAHLSTLIDYTKLNTKVICIEHDSKTQMLNNHFNNIGFRLHHITGENCIFVRNDLL